MGLESVTYISDFNSDNPVHATDPVSQGDDHIRNVKLGCLNTLPNLTGAMNASHTELNNLVGVTGKTGTGNVVLSAAPTFTGTINAAILNASGALTGASLDVGSGAIDGGAITGGAIVGTSLSAGVGNVSGGAFTAVSLVASGAVTADSFSGDIAASNITSGTLANGRVAQSNVTQHQAALTITESQISDLGDYLTPSGDVATNLSIGNADTTLTRDSAGKIAVEGRAMFAHQDATYGSARVHVGTSEPTTEGSDGDIFLVY